MTVPDLSKPQQTFWQRWKSTTWIIIKCWAVWYAAKATFVLVYVGSGRAFTPQAANVITVAALIVAFAWYIWRYMPRRAGQLANEVEPSHGGLRKWWKSLSDMTRGNIYLCRANRRDPHAG
jgi:hypothetical protein